MLVWLAGLPKALALLWREVVPGAPLLASCVVSLGTLAPKIFDNRAVTTLYTEVCKFFKELGWLVRLSEVVQGCLQVCRAMRTRAAYC